MEVKFVDLEGTEKQIQYAEMIRQTNINQVIKFCEASKVKFTSPDEAKTAIAHKAIDKAFRKLTIQNNAKWWIENKDRLDSKVQGWFMETIKAEMSK
jgi:hypothetical protein